jgi:hypothetical protein
MGHGLVCASPLLAPVCLMLSICFSNVIVYVYYSCVKIKLNINNNKQSRNLNCEVIYLDTHNLQQI